MAVETTCIHYTLFFFQFSAYFIWWNLWWRIIRPCASETTLHDTWHLVSSAALPHEGRSNISCWSYFNRPVTLPCLWKRKCEWTKIIQIHPISRISQPWPAFTHNHFFIKACSQVSLVLAPRLTIFLGIAELIVVTFDEITSDPTQSIPKLLHRKHIASNSGGGIGGLILKISQTSTLTMASRGRGYFANDPSASSQLLPLRRHTISVDGRIEKPWTNGLQGSSKSSIWKDVF